MHALSHKGKENQLKGNLFQHNKQISWCSNHLKFIVSLLLGCFEVVVLFFWGFLGHTPDGSEAQVWSELLCYLRHSADNRQ